MSFSTRFPDWNGWIFIPVPVKVFYMGIADDKFTHWGWVTHICVGNLTIIGSAIGLSPGRRQAITWTNVGILLIGPLGTNFSEMLIKIHTFSFKKIHLKMSSGKWRPFCLGLNVLMFKGLSPVTRNLCCQSARGNRSGAVRYFPEAVRPRGNTAAPDRFPRADWQHKFLVTGLNPDYNMVTVRV